jgi:hypothetical protein
MAYQGTFAAGQVLTAAELNALGAVCVLEDTFTVATSTNVDCGFGAGTEIIDKGDWHDTVTNNGRIYVPADGIYMVTASAYQLVGSPNLGRILVFQNGAATFGQYCAQNIDSTATFIADCAANDYFNVRVWQNSGSTRTPVVRFAVWLVSET